MGQKAFKRAPTALSKENWGIWKELRWDGKARLWHAGRAGAIWLFHFADQERAIERCQRVTEIRTKQEKRTASGQACGLGDQLRCNNYKQQQIGNEQIKSSGSVEFYPMLWRGKEKEGVATSGRGGSFSTGRYAVSRRGCQVCGP